MSSLKKKDVADAIFYDLKTGKQILFLDTLKISSIERTSEIYASGGNGSRTISGIEKGVDCHS